MDRVAQHIEAFNHAVTTGDWDAFVEQFAEDARMSFVDVPAGPFEGRTAIAQAYQDNPPTETMTALDISSDNLTDRARFAWASGDTGTMHLTWTPSGQLAALVVTFD